MLPTHIRPTHIRPIHIHIRPIHRLYAYAAAGFGIAGGAVDFSTVLT